MLGIDPLYIMMLLPALLLSGIATLVTRATFNKYSKKMTSSGVTGAQAAQRLLNSHGVYDVNIEPVQGFLSDHYDPRTKTLRLSPDVYASQSLSAIGVACHEAGHALQHAASYAPLVLRTALVPVAQVGSHASYILILLGSFMASMGMIKLGIVLFSCTVLFTLVTLPVEWNASSRAKALMVSSGVVTAAERRSAGAVLNAAFMTYLAAALTALITLVYYLMRAGLIGGRRD
ncbi:MAG: zinc metallopeptidase [bacterium]